MIEFYYDFGSPNAYLVHKVLPGIAGDRPVEYRPVLLGGVFKATNNQSPITAFAGVKGKNAYQFLEIRRFIERHGLAFEMNSHFPVNTLMLMRGAVFASGRPWEAAYVDAVFKTMWVDGEKMDDPPTVMRVLEAAGLPAAEIAAGVSEDGVKQGLIAATEAAVARGVFGAPTMFLGDEMFFGKDSLSDLAWRLGA